MVAVQVAYQTKPRIGEY